MKTTINATVMAILVLVSVAGHEALGMRESAAPKFQTIPHAEGTSVALAEGYDDYMKYMERDRWQSYQAPYDVNTEDTDDSAEYDPTEIKKEESSSSGTSGYSDDETGTYGLGEFILFFSKPTVIVFDADTSETLMAFAQNSSNPNYTTDTSLVSEIQGCKFPIPVWITETYTVTSRSQDTLTVDVESDNEANTYEVYVYDDDDTQVLYWSGEIGN